MWLPSWIRLGHQWGVIRIRPVDWNIASLKALHHLGRRLAPWQRFVLAEVEQLRHPGHFGLYYASGSPTKLGGAPLPGGYTISTIPNAIPCVFRHLFPVLVSVINANHNSPNIVISHMRNPTAGSRDVTGLTQCTPINFATWGFDLWTVQ